jgi:hypothetical protein
MIISFRISLVVGLAVFGILLMNGMDAVTAVFRGFIVAVGMLVITAIFRYLSHVIVPQLREPAPQQAEGDEE